MHKIFEEELARHGVTCMMRNLVPWCTGERGVTDYKAHFSGPDEH